MGGLLGTVAAVGALYDLFKASKIGKSIGADKTAGYADVLKTAGIGKTEIDLINSGGDMVKILGNMILEPTIIVSKSMYARKDINGVIDSSVDAYIGFYTAVFRVLTIVYNMEPMMALSLLSNKGMDRESHEELVAGVMDLEGISALPLGSNIDAEMFARDVLPNAVKIEKTDIKRTSDIKKDDKQDFFAKTVIKSVNLTLNKTTTKSSGDTDTDQQNININIPITIKANVHVVDVDAMVDSFKQFGVDASFSHRWVKWRIGAITAGQLLTGSDLIEDYKKRVLNPDNFSAYINKKSMADLNIFNVIKKYRGLNRMVVTYILSERELKAVSSEVGYDIDNRLEKQKLMNTMLAFNITTIDTDREIANTYISSISGFSSTPIKKLTSGDKSNDGIEMLASALISNKPF